MNSGLAIARIWDARNGRLSSLNCVDGLVDNSTRVVVPVDKYTVVRLTDGCTPFEQWSVLDGEEKETTIE